MTPSRKKRRWVGKCWFEDPYDDGEKSIVLDEEPPQNFPEGRYRLILERVSVKKRSGYGAK